MSTKTSKLDKLKERLLKQKQKDTKNVVVTVKKKQDKKFILNVKKTEEKSAEEGKIRETLTGFLEEEYPEYVDTFASRLSSIDFSDLSPEYKLDYALQAFQKQKNATYDRQQFITGILKLPEQIREQFIREYLDQSQNALDFYKEWIDKPENTQKLTKIVEETDKSVKIAKKGGKYFVTDTKQITTDLIDGLTTYANNHNVDIEGAVTYQGILDKISGKKKKQTKVHKKVADMYLNLATVLRIPSPETLTIGDLASRIVEKENILASQVPREYFDRVTAMSRKSLKKEAEQEGLNTDDFPEVILAKLLVKNIQTSHIPKEKIIGKTSKLVPSIFLENGKPILMEQEKIDLINKLSVLTGQPKEIFKDMTIEELVYKEGKAEPTDVIRDVSKEKLQTKISKISEMVSREDLIGKLARISGKPGSFFGSYSTEKLNKKLQQYSQLDEYQDAVAKEEIIDALYKLTGREKSAFFSRDVENLREELDLLQREKRVGDDIVSLRECIQRFRDYKWIRAQVTGVWLAGNSLELAEYISPTESIVAKTAQGKFKFFSANRRFFSLQCNKYANRRTQDGDILTCYDIDGKPVSMTVAYSIIDKFGYYANQSVRIRHDKSQRLLIQDEQVFQDELDYYKKERNSSVLRVENLLEREIDPNSIQTASYVLSSVLSKIAPDNKDYEVDSPYIRIAIDSLIKRLMSRLRKNLTNRELFTGIAEITVYLQLSQYSIFKKRVKAEYYLPEVLVALSPEDKLPEVFTNPNIDKKTEEITSSYLLDQISESVRGMGDVLLFTLDPTAKRILRNTKPIREPEIQYSQQACQNGQDLKIIPANNLVFYRDPSTEKVYCLDLVKIIDNFDKKNYVNPYTGEKFDKNFIRRHMILYYDTETGRNIAFPSRDLYRQFRKGNYLNEKTGKQFEPEFVQTVLKGSTWEDSVHYKGTAFAKLDSHLAMCRNPEDITYESPENVVYYKDKDGIYCFSVEKLHTLLLEGGDNAINPVTGRPFSKKFIRKFKTDFNVDLHRKGLRKSMYKGNDEYRGFFVRKQEEEKIPDVFSGSQPSTESKKLVEELVIPDLWDIVTKNVHSMEKKMKKDEEAEEAENAEESGADSEAESNNEDSQTEDDEEASGDKDDGDEDSGAEDVDDQDSKAEDSGAEDIPEEEIDEEFTKGFAELDEQEQSEEEPPVKKSKGKKSSMSFGGSDGPTKCQKCGAEQIKIKSITYDGEKPTMVGFCCEKCMEDWDFPKIKKGKKSPKK